MNFAQSKRYYPATIDPLEGIEIEYEDDGVMKFSPRKNFENFSRLREKKWCDSSPLELLPESVMQKSAAWIGSTFPRRTSRSMLAGLRLGRVASFQFRRIFQNGSLHIEKIRPSGCIREYFEPTFLAFSLRNYSR
jgi:hypothetical protein